MNAPLRTDPLRDDLGLVGISPAIERIRAQIHRYARVKGPVVVSGESGTGKELVAHALHTAGPRSNGPFVAVNAAALPESLLGSELFGHVRGAFTGAQCPHRGLFEQATGGTLFLDEVAELGPDAQAQLLRVLETGELRPVGSERTVRVDVRLVVAGAANLRMLIAAGSFRADLYHRLACLAIELPPLRRRKEDIPVLAKHLLDRIEQEVGHRELAPNAIAVLQTHPWPGNIRELANVLYRAAVGTDTTVLDKDAIQVALGNRQPGAGEDPVQDHTLCAAFTASGGNLSRAARKLGIARSTLRDRLHRLDLRTTE